MKNLLPIPLIILLISCSDLSVGFNLQALSVDIQKKEKVLLSDYTSFEWSHVYIFPPYTPKEEVKRMSGLQRSTIIDTSDSITLLVFKKKDTVVAQIEVERYKADFSELFQEKGYLRSDAEFLVDRRDSWTYLIANQTVG